MVVKLFLYLLATAAIYLASAAPSSEVDNEIDHDQFDIIDLSHLGAHIYGVPKEEAGKILDLWDPETDGRNPEELGPYAEGDILVTKRKGRNGLSDTATRWRNGIVPFTIEGSFTAKNMAIIEQAINEYHTKTCIRFKPRYGEKDYLAFVSKNTGCWSSVGRVGGRQEINLQNPGCLTKVGTPIHEMMHAIGFLHEQNRFERDEFITIRYENIDPTTKSNFYKADAKTTTAFGVGYDYSSVMHYSDTAFSTNGRKTIVAKYALPATTMGQREQLSEADVIKINVMYGCNRPPFPIYHPFPQYPSYDYNSWLPNKFYDEIESVKETEESEGIAIAGGIQVAENEVYDYNKVAIDAAEYVQTSNEDEDEDVASQTSIASGNSSAESVKSETSDAVVGGQQMANITVKIENN